MKISITPPKNGSKTKIPLDVMHDSISPLSGRITERVAKEVGMEGKLARRPVARLEAF
jgi:hypothetical protein